MGGVIPVFASEATGGTVTAGATASESYSETGNQNCEVTVNIGSKFTVTIPKKITLSGADGVSAYNVTAKGNIGALECIEVVPDEDFNLKSAGKADVPTTVTQTVTSFDYADACMEDASGNLVGTTATGSVSADKDKLSAGIWSGTFYFNISLEELSQPPSPSLLSLSTEEVTLGANSAVQVNAFIDGENVNDVVTWSSDNENITVDNGLVETKASAQAGDTATVTVTANQAQTFSLMPMVMSLSETNEPEQINTVNNTGDIVTASFSVTVIDMIFSSEDEVVTALDIKPSESKQVEVTIIPASASGTVSWTTTAPSGVTLLKNGNTVTVKVADDMSAGNSYELVASYGDFSKLLKINIVSNHVHSYTATVTKEATCTEDGVKTFTCDCGGFYTEEILSTGHVWNTEYTVDKEATCTEAGSKSQHCSKCSAKTNVTEIPATGHNYVNKVCEYCGDVILEAGAYDANGVMVASWDELTNTYGLDVKKHYSGDDRTVVKSASTSAYSVLKNNTALNSVTKIVISNEVQSIGTRAFAFCDKLTSVIIPDGVTRTSYEMFYECTSLTDVTIPESVTRISQSSFFGCSSLTSVSLPNTVTTIDDSAFACSSITSIGGAGSGASLEIPASVTTIGDCAFECNNSLTSANIPEYVKTIGESLFYSCKGLTNVNIPNGITSIGANFFCGCSSLTSITIPDSVETIGYGSFSGCSGLTSITIPDNVTFIGKYAFERCTGLSSVTIGKSVSDMGWYAFQDCTGLTSVKISEGSSFIGNYAFANCSSLTSITIPTSVTSIQTFAFKDCGSLNKIKYTGSEEQWNAIAKYSYWNSGCPSDMQVVYNYTESNL